MRINKYLAILSGFFIFSSAMLVILLKKYLLLLLHHSIYYCQEMVHALPIRLPENLGEVSILAFLMILTIVMLKLVVAWIKALKIKNYLCSSLVYTNKIKQLSEKLNLQNKRSSTEIITRLLFVLVLKIPEFMFQPV